MPVTDQGVNPDRYQLIPRTLIFLTRGESVLLLKGASHKRLWAERYNGVGGHVEQGEDILSTSNFGEPRPSEEGALEWVAFDEIQAKDLVEDLPVLLPRVLKAKVGDPPFSARYHYDRDDKLVVEFAE